MQIIKKTNIAMYNSDIVTGQRECVRAAASDFSGSR